MLRQQVVASCARLDNAFPPVGVGHILPLRSVFVLFSSSFLTDTFRMPQTWIFERGSERIFVSRHRFVNCTHLIVVANDGATRSRSFDTIDDAILYQALFEDALAAAGWVLEEVVAPTDEHMAVDLGHV
jgi:hypothetical protein